MASFTHDLRRPRPPDGEEAARPHDTFDPRHQGYLRVHRYQIRDLGQAHRLPRRLQFGGQLPVLRRPRPPHPDAQGSGNCKHVCGIRPAVRRARDSTESLPYFSSGLQAQPPRPPSLSLLPTRTTRSAAPRPRKRRRHHDLRLRPLEDHHHRSKRQSQRPPPGRLRSTWSKVDEHNGASTYTTQYTYDATDNLTNITDALSNVRSLHLRRSRPPHVRTKTSTPPATAPSASTSLPTTPRATSRQRPTPTARQSTTPTTTSTDR